MSRCRYLAIDIETTGVRPFEDQILQIGAVAFNEDGESHEFETLVKHEQYHGDPFALQMNAGLLRRLADGEGMDQEAALASLIDFIERNARHAYPIGFNVGTFDMMFLREAANSHGVEIPVARRSIELGTLLMAHLGAERPVSPRDAVMEFCLTEVANDALQDARDAATIFKKVMGW